MERKVLLGLVVIVVLIGGVSAFGFFQPLQKNDDQNVQTPSASTQPASQPAPQENDKNTVNAQDQICSKCSGNGFLKCGTCGGTGIKKLKCATCGGDGEVYNDGSKIYPNVIQLVYVLACHTETCSACGGNGGSQGTCTACGGDGKIPCSACGGDGRV